jgi:hypothetical protein
MRIFILREGKTYGPYAVEEIQRYLATGHVSLHDQACAGGAATWSPLHRVLGQPAGETVAPADALPRAEAPGAAAESEPLYHHVSLLKFSVLAVCTFGIYPLYWFYRNWRFIRQRDNRKLWPFWRAVFSPLWCYPLYRDLAVAAGRQTPAWAVAAALLYFLLGVASRLPDPYWLVSLASFVVLLPAVRQIDELNRRAGRRAAYYTRFRLRHWSACLLGCGLLALVLPPALRLTPASSVVRGDQLQPREREFFRAQRLVEPGEVIHYFYSGGMLSIKSDGNIVTDRRLISYFEDSDDDEFVVQQARYADIKDLQVTYSTSFLEDTEVTVVTDEDEEFVLLFSAEERRDRECVDKLMQLWKAARAEAATSSAR